MGHYKSNLRDIEFNLFEVLRPRRRPGLTAPTRTSTPTPPARCSRRSRASPRTSSPSPSRTPTATRRSTTRRPRPVTMPESFTKSYEAYRDSGFWGIDLPAELDGTVAPPSLRWAVNEMRPRRQPGRRDVRRVLRLRQAALRPRQRRAEEARALDRREGLALHDGAHRARRRAPTSAPAAPRRPRTPTAPGTSPASSASSPAPSPTWSTTSSTSSSPAPRAPAPAPRACRSSSSPSTHVDLETGELGERNGVYVTNVEKKMGLKVSTTCELTFGGEKPAVGTLLGDVHDGIAQMFHVIENARMMVGTKAIATLSTGYLNALDYAKQRVQGADLTQQTDKAAPRVTITHHPDVRRSLMTAEGVRRGPARAGPLHRDPAGHRRPAAARAPGPRRSSTGSAAEHRQPGQRPAAADRQGPGLRARLGAARHRVAADLRRLRLPAGLPGRAVRPRRQDRHPLRGHHRHPGPRLLLPQDRQGQGPGADPPVDADPGVRQGPRRATAAASTASASCSARASRTSRASSASWSAS